MHKRRKPSGAPRSLHGFTLIELLVVIGIISVLVSILFPCFSIVREASRRIKCSSNLRQIAMGLRIYAEGNGNHFPRTYYVGSGSLVNSCLGGRGNNPSVNSFSIASPSAPVGTNNSGAALYLLIKYGMLPPDLFRCPSNLVAQTLDANDLEDYSNFPTPMRRYNSYSYAAQFPTATAAKNGWHYDLTLSPDYPIASDINPGSGGTLFNGGTLSQDASAVAYTDPPTIMARANSNNHNCDGQNVAYVDGHVEWWTSPFCGPVIRGVPFRDNIFSNNSGEDLTTGVGGAVHGLPQGTTDIVMDPCDGAI